jgi:energy-coupling factor transport system substrate-specific component
MHLRRRFVGTHGYFQSLPVVVGGILFCAAFNTLLFYINRFWLKLPLFLDMIGTLVATVFLGPFPGVLTGAVTHGCIECIYGFNGTSIAWLPVSACSALLLWFLLKRNQFNTIIHAGLAVLYITFLNAILGAVIATFVYSGITEHPVDNLVTGFLSIGHSMISSTFWARIPINSIDKAIAVFTAYGLMKLYENRTHGRARTDNY